MKKTTLIGTFLLACAPLLADGAAGKGLYAQKCKGCHGAAGQANPAIGKMLKVNLRHLGSKEVQARSDGDMAKIVTQGSGKMKPVAGLSAGQASDVVAFVRTLKQ